MSEETEEFFPETETEEAKDIEEELKEEEEEV